MNATSQRTAYAAHTHNIAASLVEQGWGAEVTELALGYRITVTNKYGETVANVIVKQSDSSVHVDAGGRGYASFHVSNSSVLAYAITTLLTA